MVTGATEAGVAFHDRPGVHPMIHLDSVSQQLPDGSGAGTRPVFEAEAEPTSA